MGINIKDGTTEASKDISARNETLNKDIAESRTIHIEAQETSDYNLDYSADILEEARPEPIVTVSSQEDFDAEEITERIKVLYDPPSSPSLSHIPIYLELPTEKCPQFCIQVRVQVTRMGRQVDKTCRSSPLCRRRK